MLLVIKGVKMKAKELIEMISGKNWENHKVFIQDTKLGFKECLEVVINNQGILLRPKNDDFVKVEK